MISDYTNYLNELKKEFPDIPEEGLKNVLHHGFKMFQHINAAGGDVLIKNNISDSITAYCGNLYFNPLKRKQYSTKKWHIKEKLKSLIKKIEYSGYYYFGLNKEDGDLFIKKLNNKKSENITILNIIFRQQLSDVQHDTHLHYIFKLEYPLDVGFTFYKEKFTYPKEFIEYVKINDESLWNNHKTPLQKD